MIRHLLVPLDGSSFGELALPLASTIARKSNAAVHLAHVHVPPANVGIEAMSMLTDDRTRENELSYLDAVAGRLRDSLHLPVDSVVLDGPIVDSLLAKIEALDVDHVIMTTHGRGPLSRFWLGSVVDELLRRTKVPLLLTRPQEANRPSEAEPAFRRILIPLDGSRLAEQIIEPAIELGSLWGASYTLLQVIEPLPLVGFDATGYARGMIDQVAVSRLQETASTYLELVAERFRKRSLPVRLLTSIQVQAATAILDSALELSADLVALRTHGRGGLARLFLGSVADKVVRGSTGTILVHRASGAAPGK